MTRATLKRILAIGAITGMLQDALVVGAGTLYARQDDGRLHGIR